MMKQISTLRISLYLAVLVLSLLPARRALADLYCEITSQEEVFGFRGRPMQSIKRERVFIKENLVKVYDEMRNETWIYNLDIKSFLKIDHRRKAYSEGSFEELKSLIEARKKKELADLDHMLTLSPGRSEEDRERRMVLIEGRKKLLTLGKATFRLKKTGEKMKIGEKSCRLIKVYLEKELYEKVWVTDEIKPGEEYSDFLKLMSEIDPPIYSPYLNIKGFPMRTELLYKGLEQTIEVKMVTEGPVPITEFLIPQGLKKIAPSL